MSLCRAVFSLRVVPFAVCSLSLLLFFLIGSVVHSADKSESTATVWAGVSANSVAEVSKSGRSGYYRFPAIHGDTIVFTAEGDLWVVGAKGGAARRLTSNPGEETSAVISPDGTTVAFSAQYEGPMEVYTMSIEGGLPQRRTWEGNAGVAAWMPDQRLLVGTRRYSTLPEKIGRAHV